MLAFRAVFLPALLLAAVLGLAACGGSSTVTVHGQVAPNGASSALGLGGDVTIYAMGGRCGSDGMVPRETDLGDLRGQPAERR